MPIFKIKDDDDNVINVISANESFVASRYSNYEKMPDPVKGDKEKKADAREWRDSELERTDIFATVSDYPHTTELTAYRTALRDWPSTDDFPDTRPESLEDRIANA